MTEKKRTNWKEKFKHLEGRFSEIEHYRKEAKRFNRQVIRIEVIHTIVASLLVIITFKQCEILSSQNDLINTQNKTLSEQNELFANQNKKIDKQVYLEEATRRNNQVLLMDNILNQVNIELNDTSNTKDTLSTPLIGRINALAQGFQPYRFLDGDTLSKPLSPERGQLLLALANSGIAPFTLDKIYQKTTFQQAFLKIANLDHLYLKGTNLKRAVLTGADLSYVDLTGAILTGTVLRRADLKNANFKDSNLQRAILANADLRHARFDGADMKRTALTNAKVDNSNWIDTLKEIGIIGYKEIKETYHIPNEPKKDNEGHTYFLVKKRKS